jgi:hypothetical protein
MEPPQGSELTWVKSPRSTRSDDKLPCHQGDIVLISNRRPLSGDIHGIDCVPHWGTPVLAPDSRRTDLLIGIFQSTTIANWSHSHNGGAARPHGQRRSRRTTPREGDRPAVCGTRRSAAGRLTGGARSTPVASGVAEDAAGRAAVTWSGSCSPTPSRGWLACAGIRPLRRIPTRACPRSSRRQLAPGSPNGAAGRDPTPPTDPDHASSGMSLSSRPPGASR